MHIARVYERLPRLQTQFRVSRSFRPRNPANLGLTIRFWIRRKEHTLRTRQPGKQRPRRRSSRYRKKRNRFLSHITLRRVAAIQAYITAFSIAFFHDTFFVFDRLKNI